MFQRDRRPLPHLARLRAEETQHAEVRRVARPYLDGYLTPKLGLTGCQLLSDRPRGQVWAADWESRRVIVKLYAAHSAGVARRSAAVHDRLTAQGLDLAELLFRDLESDSEVGRGCVGLVYAFVPGGPPRKADAKLEARAFQNLARIHATAPPDLAPGVDAFVRAGETYAGDSDSLAALLGGPFSRLQPRDLGRVSDWCDETTAILAQAELRDSLLHADYHRGNLIEAPDGRLVTIDLDEALVGPFHWELGAAILRCLWGTTARDLDGLSLADLLAHPRVLAAEAAYFACAPDDAAAFWRAHRERVITAAYLRTIARLALRSGSAEFYSARKRLRFRRQARTRWRRVLESI